MKRSFALSRELEKILRDIDRPKQKVIDIPLVEEKHINVSGEDAVGDDPELKDIETIDPDDGVREDST